MNEKLTKLKQKAKDNSGKIALFTAGAIASFSAYALYKSNQTLEENNEILERANEDLKWMNQMLRAVHQAVEHATETGHTVTIRNDDGKPLFDISRPSGN